MKYSPSKLVDPRNMITLDNIPEDLRPPYAALNKLEQKLKDQWATDESVSFIFNYLHCRQFCS
jgi:hypothetical protein